ncbi:PaaI family thioesterase [Psychromarinibacter sp. C21-152]|uniref:PaaI family thioesterase n=1 Tax=Psychromarinibacter sediminicola TaxID=3033385 RepID=A0AAE3NMZ8_9RHOB|nr:PaaI family thioesterase [Psychromarinibacter sediminicola]MDF0599269.1 PaaI family thioesterase [Psychromarinibacter sediminicola]
MTDATLTDAPLPDGWKAMRIGGLWDAIGPLLARRDGDSWRYGLQTDARHANPVGLIHGGTLTALLDHAMTLIALTANDKQPAVTVQMETRFLSAARPGDLLEADARLDRRTGSMMFLSCTLSVAGDEIATGSAIMKAARAQREDAR